MMRSMATVMFHEPAEPDAAGGSVTFTTAALDATSKETLVNDGFLKASHRDSDATPMPVTPGTAIDSVIPIRAQHDRFVAGHSVRLRISGGKSTSLAPVAEPVDISIQAGSASALYLSPGW
jgi:predicted acyl esterase